MEQNGGIGADRKGGNMKDIKFRGKRKDNKEWVYGNFVEKVNYIGGDTQTCIQIFTHRADDADRWVEVFESELIEVEPNTVGQYVGMSDKNYKEIYKGDNVKFANLDEVAEIDFMNGSFIVRFKSVKPITLLDAMIEYGKITCKIVGNIY